MRLIDADRLKEYFNQDNFRGFVIAKIIDMQPTINPDCPLPDVQRATKVQSEPCEIEIQQPNRWLETV